jgi:fatty-acyl-CoA synthase
VYPIDYFWRSSRLFAERVAIISALGNLTYRDLAAKVFEDAARLTAVDSQPGTPICIAASNSVDHLIKILAVLAAGKIWVPLNPHNGDAELKRNIDFVEPSLVLTDNEMANRLAPFHPQVRLLSDFGSKLAPSNLVRMGPSSAYAVPLDCTQAIKFTGGTTGFPKGVLQPIRAWNTTVVTQRIELRLTAEDRYLICAPLTHGTSTYMLPVLASGGALVFPSARNADVLLGEIERSEATLLFAPPTLIMSLVEEQGLRPRRTNSLRYLIYGGAPMRPDRIRDAQDSFGQVVCTSYGQTEAPQIVTFLPPSQMCGDLLGSVGRPTLLTQVAVLAAEGHSLGEKQGEIAVRGDLVMSGYLNAPEETRRVLFDGWLRTGDVGTIDERGYVFITDRIRDTIITGGFNVYPSDVEAVLARHPAIFDCSVVGVPDAKWGEAVCAAIQLRDGQGIDTKSLLKLVKDELGSVKSPKGIYVFDSLPRSPVGKTLKSLIKTEIIRRREFS